MGRDVTGLRIDNKPSMVNDKSNGTLQKAVHVAPKASPEKAVEKDYEVENGHNADEQKQDVLVVKSTNHEPEEKIIKAESQKSAEKKSNVPTKSADTTSFDHLTPCLEVEKQQTSCENNGSGVKVLTKSNDSHSPESAKKSQFNSHYMPRKQLQPNNKNYYDEEDNWSLASSTATSVRSKITVPVAPRFTCVDRLSRRKEFYTKLEEKHKALEKEKQEYEARTKEEEQAAIKLLRRNMVVKANPVPGFYREGPPPKVELKKLPVTRAKSPNLTRRKSCGDAVKPSPEDKGSCGRATRHSVGVYRDGKASSPLQKKASPITPKTKDQRKLSIGSTNKIKNRPQHVKEMITENPKETIAGNPKETTTEKPKETTTENPRMEENGNADIAAVES